MTSYYRIYCETNSKWEYEWTNIAPTVCPTDESHTINTNSIQKVPTVVTYKRFEFANKKYKKKDLKTNSWKKLTSYQFPGTDEIGCLRRINIIAYMNKDKSNKEGTSTFGYYVRIYDKTNTTIIYDTSYCAGTDLVQNYNFEDLINSNQSSDGAIWEISVKKGSKAGDLYLDGVDLYFYKN